MSQDNNILDREIIPIRIEQICFVRRPANIHDIMRSISYPMQSVNTKSRGDTLLYTQPQEITPLSSTTQVLEPS